MVFFFFLLLFSRLRYMKNFYWRGLKDINKQRYQNPFSFLNISHPHFSIFFSLAHIIYSLLHDFFFIFSMPFLVYFCALHFSILFAVSYIYFFVLLFMMLRGHQKNFFNLKILRGDPQIKGF